MLLRAEGKSGIIRPGFDIIGLQREARLGRNFADSALKQPMADIQAFSIRVFAERTANFRIVAKSTTLAKVENAGAA